MFETNPKLCLEVENERENKVNKLEIMYDIVIKKDKRGRKLYQQRRKLEKEKKIWFFIIPFFLITVVRGRELSELKPEYMKTDKHLSAQFASLRYCPILSLISNRKSNKRINFSCIYFQIFILKNSLFLLLS